MLSLVRSIGLAMIACAMLGCAGGSAGPYVRVEAIDQGSRWINGVVVEGGHVMTCLSALGGPAAVRIHTSAGVVEALGLSGYHADANVALLDVNWGRAPRTPLSIAAETPRAGAALECVMLDDAGRVRRRGVNAEGGGSVAAARQGLRPAP
jgi:hypothetical protein